MLSCAQSLNEILCEGYGIFLYMQMRTQERMGYREKETIGHLTNLISLNCVIRIFMCTGENHSSLEETFVIATANNMRTLLINDTKNWKQRSRRHPGCWGGRSWRGGLWCQIRLVIQHFHSTRCQGWLYRVKEQERGEGARGGSGTGKTSRKERYIVKHQKRGAWHQ